MLRPFCNASVNVGKYSKRRLYLCDRALTTVTHGQKKQPNHITLLNEKYPTDDWTNITKNILSKLGKKLYTTPYHPLSHIRQKITDYFYLRFRNRLGSPIFSVYDNLPPVVSVSQNFDSLLVPADHPSRRKSECYYVNKDTLLRAHTTAHQSDLISMGLNNFLVVGDVYRRDEIDRTHYPIFHQVDAVRLCTLDDILNVTGGTRDLRLFEEGCTESAEKQACHTLDAVRAMENELKTTLIGLAETIFGAGIKYKWTEQYFPFTHPSWELEVLYNDKWLEVLGCGIMRQEILERSGAYDRIGWAFGLGLERLAMCQYDIPDIRLFWSNDSGFLNQFKVDDPNVNIKYMAISIFPQCKNDMSFWLPTDGSYNKNDFYDLVRDIGGDCIEQITLKDEYVVPEGTKVSHCYTIVYRHMKRTLSKKEVNQIHQRIAEAASKKLNVKIR